MIDLKHCGVDLRFHAGVYNPSVLDEDTKSFFINIVACENGTASVLIRYNIEPDSDVKIHRVQIIIDIL